MTVFDYRPLHLGTTRSQSPFTTPRVTCPACRGTLENGTAPRFLLDFGRAASHVAAICYGSAEFFDFTPAHSEIGRPAYRAIRLRCVSPIVAVWHGMDGVLEWNCMLDSRRETGRPKVTAPEKPMVTRTTTVTAEQLLVLPDDGKRYELIQGELRMMSPAGGRHGRVAHNVGLILGTHVRQTELGVVFAAETGFLIARDPDTVRAPDVAFVNGERLEHIEDDAGYLPLAPDLVGEVISPSDTFSEVEKKAFGWLSAGTRMVLLIDPETRTLHVYRAADRILVLNEEAELDACDVVPGWRFRVGELFR